MGSIVGSLHFGQLQLQQQSCIMLKQHVDNSQQQTEMDLTNEKNMQITHTHPKSHIFLKFYSLEMIKFYTLCYFFYFDLRFNYKL